MLMNLGFALPHIGPIAEILHPRAGEAGRPIEFEDGDRLLEIRRGKPIVGVETTDVLAARFGNAPVARRRQSCVRLAHNA